MTEMFGLGTIINVVAIIVGGVMGLLFGKKLTESGLSFSGSMMMIVCFAVGALIGEWIDLDTKMEQFGEWLKEKTKSEGDNSFVDAFVTASLTVCIGAMAVVGSIKDGIYGDYLSRKGSPGHDHRRDHDGIHGKGMYLFGDPGGNVPGSDDTAGEAH